MHNLLFLAATDAFGLITFFDGPHLGKGTDRTTFRDSEILHHFRAALVTADIDPDTYGLLGDKIFVDHVPNIYALPSHAANYADPASFDRIDSKCRTSSEWVFCKITQNWKYIGYDDQLRIQLNDVGVDIIVAALLTNCLTLLQGNQTRHFFSSTEDPFLLDMPSLESYFDMPEVHV